MCSGSTVRQHSEAQRPAPLCNRAIERAHQSVFEMAEAQASAGSKYPSVLLHVEDAVHDTGGNVVLIPSAIVQRSKFMTDFLDSKGQALWDFTMCPEESGDPLQLEKKWVQKWLAVVSGCASDLEWKANVYDTESLCAVLGVADFLHDEQCVKQCAAELSQRLSLSSSLSTICARASEQHIAMMLPHGGLPVRLDNVASLPMESTKRDGILGACLATACASPLTLTQPHACLRTRSCSSLCDFLRAFMCDVMCARTKQFAIRHT